MCTRWEYCEVAGGLGCSDVACCMAMLRSDSMWSRREPLPHSSVAMMRLTAPPCGGRGGVREVRFPLSGQEFAPGVEAPRRKIMDK